MKFLIPFSLLTAATGHVKQPLPPVLVLATSTVDAVEQVAQPFSFTPAAASLASSAAEHVNVAAILLVFWAVGFATMVLLWSVRWSRINAAVPPRFTCWWKPYSGSIRLSGGWERG